MSQNEIWKETLFVVYQNKSMTLVDNIIIQ